MHSKFSIPQKVMFGRGKGLRFAYTRPGQEIAIQKGKARRAGPLNSLERSLSGSRLPAFGRLRYTLALIESGTFSPSLRHAFPQSLVGMVARKSGHALALVSFRQVSFRWSHGQVPSALWDSVQVEH